MLGYLKLRQYRMHKHRPLLRLNSTKGIYRARLAKSLMDLRNCASLRHEVFCAEFQGARQPLGLELDSFDHRCDHLIIENTQTQRIVATARINSLMHQETFIAAEQFNLRALRESPGIKLEIGRACIRSGARNNYVTNLLWHSIADLLHQAKAEYVFGLASVNSRSPLHAALVVRYLQMERALLPEYLGCPNLRAVIPGFESWLAQTPDPLTWQQTQEAKSLISPLFAAAIGAGARVSCEPAFDPVMNCLDFLTILDRDNLNRILWSRNSVWQKSQFPAENISLLKSS